eukprot:14582362-Heterocapsa_arctica.AAC.1
MLKEGLQRCHERNLTEKLSGMVEVDDMEVQEEMPSRRRASLEPAARFIASSRTTANQKGIARCLVCDGIWTRRRAFEA